MTTIHLRVGLANKVSELISDTAFHRAIQMLDVVYNRIYMYQTKKLSEWVEIPTDYVYKVLSRRYSSIWKNWWLIILLNAKVLLVHLTINVTSTDFILITAAAQK